MAMNTLDNIDRTQLMEIITGRKRYNSSNNFKYDHLEICEFLLTNKLKDVCNDKGVETNIQESAKVLHQLGRVYRDRVSIASGPNMFAMIRSAVLFKAAIVRKPDNVMEIEKDLRELCSHVLKLSGAEHGAICLTDKAELLMKDITKMREQFKIKLYSKTITEEHELQTTHGKLNKIEQIEELQHEICDWYTKTMKDVMEYCLLVQGKAPCEYALIGMGSLAKKEITPYSDFEHAILLDNAVQSQDLEKTLEYFRWVSVLFQLVIVLLGETIPPNINLPYLNNPFNKKHDWFFDVHTTRGISFDGMTPYACKFPLGRPATPKKPWKIELIRTVRQMLRFLDVKEDLKNGYHLADMLMSTCYVSGNRDLFDFFCDGVKKFMEENQCTKSLKQHICEDVKNFHPIGCLDKISKKQKWNMKRVVYRSTTLFISALGKHHQSLAVSSFDIVRQLTFKGFVDSDFALDLLIAVAVACYVRLITYFDKDGQDDWIEAEQFDIEFMQAIGTKTAVQYFRTAMKLQRETCNRIGLRKSNFVQSSASLDHLLACFWLRQRQDALYEAERMYSDRNSAEEMRIIHEVVLTTGHQYYEEKNYFQALRCFKLLYANWSDDSSHPCKDDLAHCLLWLGGCSYHDGKYAEALNHFKNELQARKQITDTGNSSNDIAVCHHNLGHTLFQLKYYDKAIESFKAASALREASEDMSLRDDIAADKHTIALCLFELQKYKDALKCHQEALKIRKRMVTDKKRDAVAANYRQGIGNCFLKLSKYADARKCFEKAKSTQILNGEPSLKSSIAENVNSIGVCFDEQNLHSEALVHFEEALEIRKIIAEDEGTDKAYAIYCYNMGDCLRQMKRSVEARSFFEKSKAILVSNGDPSLKSDIARNENRIGDCFSQQELYSEALVHYEKSMNMRKLIAQNEDVDNVYAVYCYDMGYCLYKLKRIDEAMTFFQKAKTVRENNGDPSLKSQLAVDAKSIAECYCEKQMYIESLVYYYEAMTIQKSIVEDENVDSQYAIYCQNVGASLFWLGKVDKARTLFEKANHILQNYGGPSRKFQAALTTKSIGVCFCEQKKYREALVHHGEALSILKSIADHESFDEAYEEILDAIEVCIRRWKNVNKVRKVLQKVKTFFARFGNPSLRWYSAIAKKWVGDCFYEAKMFREALAHYEEAIYFPNGTGSEERVDPMYSDVNHNMGCCLIELRRFNEARKYFLQAISILINKEDPGLQPQIAAIERKIRDSFRQQELSS